MKNLIKATTVTTVALLMMVLGGNANAGTFIASDGTKVSISMEKDYSEFDNCHERNQDKINTQNLLISASMVIPYIHLGNLIDVLAVTAVTEATMEQEDCSKHL